MESSSRRSWNYTVPNCSVYFSNQVIRAKHLYKCRLLVSAHLSYVFFTDEKIFIHETLQHQNNRQMLKKDQQYRSSKNYRPKVLYMIYRWSGPGSAPLGRRRWSELNTILTSPRWMNLLLAGLGARAFH